MDQPRLVSLVATSSTTLVANYDQTINAASCDPVGPLGSDFTVTANGAAQTVQSVSCDNSGTVANGGNAAGLGEATITLSAALPLGGGATVTAKNGPDSNTVCANNSTTNCEAVGDTASTVVPKMMTVAQQGAITANTLLITYDRPVTCGASAAPDFMISTDQGSSCAAGSNANQITVTFALPFTAGTYPVTYTGPGAPTAVNTVHSATDFALSPQTISGVVIQ